MENQIEKKIKNDWKLLLEFGSGVQGIEVGGLGLEDLGAWNLGFQLLRVFEVWGFRCCRYRRNGA